MGNALLPGFGGVIGGTIGAWLEEEFIVMNYLDKLINFLFIRF